MKSYLLIILIFINFNCLHGQFIISGKVLNEKGSPIQNTNIKILDNNNGCITDEDGYYKLISKKKEFEIKISSIGFKTEIKKIIFYEKREIVTNFTLISDSYELEQIVVTGNTGEILKKKSVINVELIDKKFIDKIVSKNFADILNNVRGIQNRIDCGICGSSGIQINGMNSQYNLILIDNIPLINSLSKSYGLNSIPSSIIKQIEIIKGPSSILYGSEAISGVINIITKDRKDLSRVNFNSYMSSIFEISNDITIFNEGKLFDILLNFNSFNFQKFTDNNNDNFSDLPLINRYTSFNKILFNRKSKKKFNLSTKFYLEDRFGCTNRYEEYSHGNDSIYGEDIETKKIEIYLNYDFNFIEKLEFNSGLDYHYQSSYYGYNYFKANQISYFNQLIFKKKINENIISLGVNHSIINYNDNSNLSLIDRVQNVTSLFAQNEIKSLYPINLLFGMRIDFHQNHNKIFSPRFNIKYDFKNNSSIRINSGSGFRIVNIFSEEHALLSGSKSVEISDDIDPEKSINMNINYTLPFDKIKFEIDLFLNKFFNKIIPNFQLNVDKIVFENLKGNSISKGLTFKYDIFFNRFINFSNSISFLKIKTINNYILINELFIPSFSSLYNLTYKKNKFEMNIYGKFTGPMYLPKFEVEPHRKETSNLFGIHNLKLNKRIKNFLIYIGIENFFNYSQKNPLIDPNASENSETGESWNEGFSPNFDTSYIYSPLFGRKIIFGINIVL